jgi:hypothetical protein
MRSALLILIGIHGIIHLFGFIKAFDLSEFNTITQFISKTYGIFWLLACDLFMATFVLYLCHSKYWLLSGLLAVILSQLLIISLWSDTKFGTIANLIILIALIIGYAGYHFNNKIKSERIALFENAHITNHTIVTQEAISKLPPIVQKWLTNSGVVGKTSIANVHITQELLLKMKPEQEDWYPGTAEQYFTIQPPAFNWNINTKMNPVLEVVGRDKFEKGQGEMIIKLCSLIPVANAKNNNKVNQATLQRFLAEMVWFPSAALSPYIKWETVNDFCAKATMDYQGTKGSGEFYFDTNGNFTKFVAMRFRDANAIEATEWTVTATKTEQRHGINIPVECEAKWKLNSGQWTWLKLKIKDIQYNLYTFPAANNVKD